MDSIFPEAEMSPCDIFATSCESIIILKLEVFFFFIFFFFYLILFYFLNFT